VITAYTICKLPDFPISHCFLSDNSSKNLSLSYILIYAVVERLEKLIAAILVGLYTGEVESATGVIAWVTFSIT